MAGSTARGSTVARVALAISLGIAVATASGATPASGDATPRSRCRPPVGYTHVDIGSLGTGFDDPVDVNDRGVVVGRSETPDGMHVFVWRRGRMTDITPPGGSDATVAGVNDRGSVAHSWADLVAARYQTVIWHNGRSTASISGEPVRDFNERGDVLFFDAGLWRDGRFVPISGDLGGRLLFEELGDGGHVAGVVLPPTPPGGGHPTPSTGFVWHDGVLTAAVPPPGTSFAVAVDVNRSGSVLFYAFSSSNALWHDGITTDLGSLGGTSLVAEDINDRGQVIGEATTASGEWHPFLWEAGTITDLHPVDGETSSVTAINERGEVLGSTSSDGTVVWSCGATVSLGLGAVGVDINDRGQVLSVAFTEPGQPMRLSTPIRR
ncbi:MAG TPA: hypothetical protein VK611_14195 [Acidimicrobiales bacterium]|nr:hypothetical protein [Acidimicrobiales bacterium]